MKIIDDRVSGENKHSKSADNKKLTSSYVQLKTYTADKINDELKMNKGKHTDNLITPDYKRKIADINATWKI